MDTTDLPLLFIAKKLLAVALQPPLLPMLLVLACLLLWRWRPRAARVLGWSGLAIMLILSTPLTVAWLAAPLEAFPVIDAAQLRRAQAIVILAGGQLRYAPEYGGQTVNRITLERIRYGARLAREAKLPVLVTGGAPTGVRPEAVAMAQALERDFSLAPAWIEARSLDTHDNAVLSAEILRKNGIERIVLVTHAAHMRRAVGEFEAVGLTVFPAPTAFFSHGSNGEEFFDYLPGATPAYAGFYVVHEWLGLAAQRVRSVLD